MGTSAFGYWTLTTTASGSGWRPRRTSAWTAKKSRNAAAPRRRSTTRSPPRGAVCVIRREEPRITAGRTDGVARIDRDSCRECTPISTKVILAVVRGSRAGEEYVFDGYGRCVVGREGCDICLPRSPGHLDVS